jgi:hypothetical protein
MQLHNLRAIFDIRNHNNNLSTLQIVVNKVVGQKFSDEKVAWSKTLRPGYRKSVFRPYKDKLPDLDDRMETYVTFTRMLIMRFVVFVINAKIN